MRLGQKILPWTSYLFSYAWTSLIAPNSFFYLRFIANTTRNWGKLSGSSPQCAWLLAPRALRSSKFSCLRKQRGRCCVLDILIMQRTKYEHSVSGGEESQDDPARFTQDPALLVAIGKVAVRHGHYVRTLFPVALSGCPEQTRPFGCVKPKILRSGKARGATTSAA